MESLINDKFNSNYVPNSEEVAAIKELLVEPDRKLLDIDEEIGDITTQLERLSKEKDLDRQIKAHRLLISPARLLSPYVIRRIFFYCLPSDRNPVLSNREAPLLLGRICSQWRHIVLATPNLWAAVHITIPADPVPMPPPLGDAAPALQTDHATRTQAVTAWLSRSEPFPLSISIYHSKFDNAAGSPIYQYLDVILSFMMRWKQIHISVPHQVWNDFLPRIRASDVPLLEKIHFDSAIGYQSVLSSPDMSPRRESGILRAPKLRSVSLVQFEPHVFHLPLCWNQLTELNLSGSIPSWPAIEGLSISESLAVLTFCPNLEYFGVHLSFTGFTTLANGDYGLPRVTMTKLFGLAVTETNDVDSSPFFCHITAPALRHLKFRRTSPGSYTSPLDFTQSHSLKSIHIPFEMFIRRVNKPIKEFELDALYMSETDVLECLSLMPGLTKLSLWSCGPTGTTVSPHITLAISSWENSLFKLDDRNLKRFVPGFDKDDKRNRSPARQVISWGTQIESRPSPPLLPAPYILPSQFNSFSLPIVISTPASPGPDPAEKLSTAEGSISITSHNTEINVHGSDDARDRVLSDRLSNCGACEPASSSLSLLGSLSKNKGKSRTTGSESGFESESDSTDIRVDASDPLCPLLESFQCSGAIFSDEIMLTFLHARSSNLSSSSPSSLASDVDPGPSFDTYQRIANLRKCKIWFSTGRQQNSGTKKKLDEIRKATGMSLEVNYPPSPVAADCRRYSPYEGVPSAPVLGVAPGINADYVHTASTTGGWGSGEPVFLYGTTFH